jgi:hypothetical protein
MLVMQVKWMLQTTNKPMKRGKSTDLHYLWQSLARIIVDTIRRSVSLRGVTVMIYHKIRAKNKNSPICGPLTCGPFS